MVSWACVHRTETGRAVGQERHAKDVVSSFRFSDWHRGADFCGVVGLAAHQTLAYALTCRESRGEHQLSERLIRSFVHLVVGQGFCKFAQSFNSCDLVCSVALQLTGPPGTIVSRRDV